MNSKEAKPLSIYVHIPFCEKKCVFCCYFSRANGNHGEYILREPDIFPTPEVLADVLGMGNNQVYKKFQAELAKLDIEKEWKYYPSPMCGKCWLAQGKYRHTTPRGAKKEKTIFWFSVWDGYFVVAIWFYFLGKEPCKCGHCDCCNG